MPHIRTPQFQASPAPDEASAETLASRAYEAAHSDDTFEDLRRRARFSRQAAGLLRAWLRAARSGALGEPRQERTAGAEGIAA